MIFVPDMGRGSPGLGCGKILSPPYIVGRCLPNILNFVTLPPSGGKKTPQKLLTPTKKNLCFHLLRPGWLAFKSTPTLGLEVENFSLWQTSAKF